MGSILTISVGLLVSWFTYNENVPVKANTLSPCVRALVKKYSKTSMCEENMNSSNGNKEVCIRYTFRQ